MINKALRNARKAANKTTHDMASKLDCSVAIVEGYESGRKLIKEDVILAYAEAAGISPVSLVMYAESLRYPELNLLPADASQWMMKKPMCNGIVSACV